MLMTCVAAHCTAEPCRVLSFLFPAQHSLNTNYRVSLSLLSVLSARTEGASQAVVDANVDHITGGEEEAAMWQQDRELGSFCWEGKIWEWTKIYNKLWVCVVCAELNVSAVSLPRWLKKKETKLFSKKNAEIPAQGPVRNLCKTIRVTFLIIHIYRGCPNLFLTWPDLFW